MRIVVLTSLPRPALLPDDFLPCELRRQGIPVTAIVARQLSLRGALRLHHGERVRRLGRVATSLWKRAAETQHSREPDWAPIPVHYVKDHNSPMAADRIRALRPDLLVLGGTGIIGRQILEIPRLGTLGCHYALLPGLRGVDVTEWALFLDAPVGVCIFWVDAGVDTGDVVVQRRIEVLPGETLVQLRRRSAETGKELFVEAIRNIMHDTAVRLPQSAASEQYFAMHPRLVELVERKLGEGRSTPVSARESRNA